jgi:uncharacterized protein
MLTLKCIKPVTNEEAVFLYDNITSQIFNEDGSEIEPNRPVMANIPFFGTSKETPAGKVRQIKKLKIQLGLSCNYECTYCNQRFVPHAEETNKDDVAPFLTQLPDWFDGGSDGKGEGVIVEFWGGEPFVYWKSLKPLAEGIKHLYPNIHFSLVTNGSLLDADKNQWLDELGFSVGISHDGAAYHVRGLDPFDNPEQFASIIDLWERIGTKGRMSFNAMLHKDNQSRAAISQWFKDKLGFDVPIGEGSFIDPYDEGGASLCMTTPAEHIQYRMNAFKELHAGLGTNFNSSQRKIADFIHAVKVKRNAYSLGQKCGMDNPNNIAVDLKGNVLTCQNVSAIATSFNGESHLIGHVSDFDNIKLKTSTHWSKRKDCSNCPVLQICQGSCMFLEGEMWSLACDNAYSDNLPYFMASIEILTGFIPYYIDGDIDEGRKDIVGLVNGIPKHKKIIPIKQL